MSQRPLPNWLCLLGLPVLVVGLLLAIMAPGGWLSSLLLAGVILAATAATTLRSQRCAPGSAAHTPALALARSLIVLATGLLYLSACLAPALRVPTFDSDHEDVTGFQVLLLGWLLPLTIPWSANVVLLSSAFCLLRGQYRASFHLGRVACALGLTSWLFVALLGAKPVIGCYIWHASLLVLTGGAHLLRQYTETAATPEAAELPRQDAA